MHEAAHFGAGSGSLVRINFGSLVLGQLQREEQLAIEQEYEQDQDQQSGCYADLYPEIL